MATVDTRFAHIPVPADALDTPSAAGDKVR